MPDPNQRIEAAFVGSLVDRPGRPGGLLSSLRIDVDPQQIKDDMARAIYKAAIKASEPQWNMPPTAENLAAIIIDDELVTLPSDRSVEALSGFKSALVKQIESYAEMGFDHPNALSSIAGQIADGINKQRISTDFLTEATKLIQDRTITSTDLYDQLTMLLEAVKPNSIEPRIYEPADQRRVMAEIKKRQTALLGKPQMTFPAEWWIHDYIPYLMPGLLYVLTGLTGRGKSSMFLQLADWLERCGFTVLYCHAEDDIERQLMRRARQVAGASARELMAGDPRGKFNAVAQIAKERGTNSGGKIIFYHCIGVPPSHIRRVAANYKPDVVIVDYLQKLNVDPYRRMGGREDTALAMAVEEMKQMAENDKHQCVVILGSQEAEHDAGSEFRKGTSGTRQAEHKAQVIVEFERLRLTEADGPEIVDGIQIAGVGELSGFGACVVHKNNDGAGGRTEGVFNGLLQTFKALPYIKWQETHPGEAFSIPVLREPDEEYYRQHDAKKVAWNDLWKFYEPVKVRRQKAKKEAVEGRKSGYSNGRRGDDPF